MGVISKVWKPLIAGVLLCGAGQTTASPQGASLPYDETADARADIAAAMDRAAAQDKHVLLEFGANWCPDCRVLSAAMDAEPLAAAIDEQYVVVKIDVGNWDKNLDVVKAWGDPIGNGIPSIVVADSRGTVLYATRAGELANARRMGSTQLAEFFAALSERRQ